MPCLNSCTIETGARLSPLSRVQVQEVLDELKLHYPFVKFNSYFCKTSGDYQKLVSLRFLDRTDFFTKEIDEWVLAGTERVGIHSAKDLPSFLASGLTVFCITKGIDSSDSLVLKEPLSLDQLPLHAKIATSSEKRETAIRELRKDLTFCDIRGTIGERLEKLESKEITGVVIAEAALIRLKLTHLNRIKLPYATAEGQGKLAVVGRVEDKRLQEFFSCLDTRK